MLNTTQLVVNKEFWKHLNFILNAVQRIRINNYMLHNHKEINKYVFINLKACVLFPSRILQSSGKGKRINHQENL
jgi:hypothetical protein